jgi:hypothetical protein
MLSSHLSHFKPLKMDPTEGSKMLANINQTLGIHPKVETVNTEHSESLKSGICMFTNNKPSQQKIRPRETRRWLPSFQQVFILLSVYLNVTHQSYTSTQQQSS